MSNYKTSLNSDSDGFVKYHFQQNAKTKPNITIVTPRENMSSLLDDGDYVKIIGMVKISENEIYLDGCNYEMIESVYDRST